MRRRHSEKVLSRKNSGHALEPGRGRKTQPAAAASAVLIGALCGTAAAVGWAAGFVAAKHGVTIGFSPADLAFHRFSGPGSC